ncbi:T9SS type A sorting domain-containing protein [Chitinophaga sp. SYP-B3965]|uniref:GDSL-type esterase/lipase family protein n=1 Tax=Chitinophaga sp. SYP-B3965 TaxID=2663120 RepID=UPI001299CD06|nr:GDSL-type esterase/lipase family protein [Chitinophaga sp. SYP-B3965]MRG44987.1 T9SS type A sorting domain-containing protein [Chitinophaga sp. SYP-B3965]
MKRLLLFLCLLCAGEFCLAQNCNTPLRIVVLGSSTAWGNGVPVRDSAWTFHYRKHLKATHNTADTVYILAIGGHTTHNIQATGTAPYTVSGVTFTVDPNNNITKAISLAPHAIIVNIPSEDEARNFPLSVQIANLLKLKQLAAQNNIPLWVTTTQPRSNLGNAAALRLKQMKDSIQLYFGDKAIDFWTTVATATGQIEAAYANGDGLHLNSAGQRILFTRVADKNIPQALCQPAPVTPFQLTSFTVSRFEDKLRLNWRTNTETNTLRFIIERSTDSINWSNIGNQNAAGNSAVPRDYVFTDNTVHTSARYYRLNMEDAANVHYYTPGVKAMPDTIYHTPFRLNSFTISLVAGKLKLDWSTLLESNTVRFNIERSTNAQNWVNVGNVDAAGTATSPRSYSFTDNNPAANQLYYYRLNMQASENRNFLSNTVSGTSPGVPQNCNAPIRVVLLGSSTAWGNGLASRDSAWAFRYQRWLKANHNAQDTVINLANGSTNTHTIQPDGTPSYTVSGLTFTVDPNSNISRAVALNADVIIINMPTNDEARNFPLTQSRDNYLVLKAFAAQHNIPLWVTTTQPRGNLGVAAGVRLRQFRDTTIKYFGSRAIDFFTGLDSSNNNIKAIYNSGDDVHFNPAGHKILFDRVVAKGIPDTLCANSNAPQGLARAIVYGNDVAEETGLFIAPNPASRIVTIPGVAGKEFMLDVFNAQGVKVLSVQRASTNRLDVSQWRNGIYFIIIDNKHRYKLVKI